MIMRVKRLADMSKEHYLKPMPCPKFKQARALHRDPSKVYYYFRQRVGGVLMFEQRALITPPEDQPKPPAESTAGVVQMELFPPR